MQDTRFDNYLAQQQQKKQEHDKGLPRKWNQNTNLPCWKDLFGKN